MLSNDSCPNTSGGLQGFTPGFTETLMYRWRYTLIFIPDFVPQECCKVKERHLCPWIKRNNLQNTFAMGQNDCLLFGIKFVFQGFSHRVTIPDILKLQVPHFFRPRTPMAAWPQKRPSHNVKLLHMMQKFWGAMGARTNPTKIKLLHFFIVPWTCQMLQFWTDFRFGGPTPRAAAKLKFYYSGLLGYFEGGG